MLAFAGRFYGQWAGDLLKKDSRELVEWYNEAVAIHNEEVEAMNAEGRGKT